MIRAVIAIHNQATRALSVHRSRMCIVVRRTSLSPLFWNHLFTLSGWLFDAVNKFPFPVRRRMDVRMEVTEDVARVHWTLHELQLFALLIFAWSLSCKSRQQTETQTPDTLHTLFLNLNSVFLVSLSRTDLTHTLKLTHILPGISIKYSNSHIRSQNQNLETWSLINVIFTN